MAYTAFDPANPAGTQNGTAVPDSARNNGKAVRDAVLMGAMDGFVFSVSGGTAAQPATMFWKNGVIWMRATITWGAGTGTDGNPTTIVWELSVNSGGVYDTIDTQTFTWDTSGNLTATTGSGSWMSWLSGLLGKVKTVVAGLAAHIALTGTSVHGLGTMSTQAASAVAITGGSAALTYERETKVALGSITSSTAINWAAGGMFTVTAGSAGAALTHSNLPSGSVGFVTLDITNGGVATTLFTGLKWPGGTVQAFTVSGRDILALMCHDGAVVNVVGLLKGMA
jgi:hypothetical protein